MEISPEVVVETRKWYSKLATPYDVVMNAAGNYAFVWDVCYAQGRMTEGEFAKLVGFDFTIARQRCEELHGRSMSVKHFEDTVLWALVEDYGVCEMVYDFGYRPWRFAA